MGSRNKSQLTAPAPRAIKIMLVAPRHSDLLLEMADAEVQEILRSGGQVTPVLGSVDAADFFRQVSSNGHEVLMLITHGSEQGILLSDGWLSASMLVSAVRDRFELIFINTCSSLGMAQMIQNESGCGIVATVGEVNDRQAFYTGAQFAKEVARRADYYEAYKRSRPGGNNMYVYLAGRARDITAMIEFQDLVAQIAELRTTLTEFQTSIQAEVALLRARATGEPQGITLSRNQATWLIALLLIIAVILAVGLWL